MNNKNNGFTLIEVLIALAILAIALVAVMKAMGQSVHTAGRIKEKLAAHWVAMNALAKVQTGYIDLNKKPSPSGDEIMLGMTYHWQLQKQSQSDSASYARVTINVSKNDAKMETLTGFVRLKQ